MSTPKEVQDVKPNETQEQLDVLSFKDFLEATPPTQEKNISDLFITRKYASGSIEGYHLNLPSIEINCDTPTCNGTRVFRPSEDPRNTDFDLGKRADFFINYLCSNCRKSTKKFSISCFADKSRKTSQLYKYGELPAFGPATPAKLISLIGPDRDLFLKGRRSEYQGLGIAAFAYYRRVVENQKNRILDEVIKVSNRLEVSTEIIKQLEDAKNETQFTKSLSAISIPQTLLISGHNPFTLLHTALSDGLHDRDDAHCLDLAHSIRIILVDLSDRLHQALKEDTELKSALSKILKTASAR